VSMLRSEACELQRRIGISYPHLEVSVKQIGAKENNEYACLIESGKRYYLWSWGDWSEYRRVHEQRLGKYTDDGHREEYGKRVYRKQRRIRIVA
jgi:hypothetical protein